MQSVFETNHLSPIKSPITYTLMSKGYFIGLKRLFSNSCLVQPVSVFLSFFLCIEEFTGFEWALLTQTMENCKGVVMFCPMLAILFVGTRMFALQITDSKGSPQGWCQDGMYMATWSLLIQFVMVLVTPCATGEPAQVDEDGKHFQ